jgi:hypothetical protein
MDTAEFEALRVQAREIGRAARARKSRAEPTAPKSESAPFSGSTANASGSSSLDASDASNTSSLTAQDVVVDLDVVVDVVTQPVSTDKDQTSEHRAPKPVSEYFAELERDAQKMGCQPVEVHLPDDVPEAQRVVMEDCAYVAGVYAVHDGPGGEFPYSCRWRTQVVGFGYRTVQRALGALVDDGYLVDRGETEPHRGFPRGTKLYAVGLRAKRQAPAVEASAGEPQHEAVDLSAVGDAQLGVRGMPGMVRALRDTAQGGSHEPNLTPTNGYQVQR